MNFTTYQDFPLPLDDEAYGTAYRQWANDLDTLVRMEGPIADRPDPATVTVPAGAIYDATDQRTRYRFDGTEWVAFEGTPANRVWDTTGRAHGELTGTADAQVVIDAIANRPAGAGIVVPNPGFPLGWEQQVNLPTAEAGFSLETVGFPVLDIAGTYTGDHAIVKPAADPMATTGLDIQHYYIGPLHVDASGATTVLDGVRLSDVRQSVVDRVKVQGSNGAGVRIRSPNYSSTLNKCLFPYYSGTLGSGVILEENNANPTNLTTVFAPTFNDPNSDSTGFIDQGNFNRWLWTHVEHAAVCHEQQGTEWYQIIEGDWDRVTEYVNTVVESDGAYGRITARNGPNNYSRVRLATAATEIEAGGRPVTNAHEVLDLFARLKRITPADSLSTPTLGLLDESDAASSVSYTTAGPRGSLRFLTGATAGDQALLTQGGTGTIGTTGTVPKAFVPLSYPASAGHNAGVTVRVGFFTDVGNRCELIYDPDNALGNHPTTTWYFELASGGTLRGRTDTGIGQGTDGAAREFGVQREGLDVGADWSAHIDGTRVGLIDNAGTDIGPTQFRLSVATQRAASKQWNLPIAEGERLWIV